MDTVKKQSRRRSVNLTINEDVLQEARALQLNASQAAESGLLAAIRQAKEAAWLDENQKGLSAHNKRIEKEGPLLTPLWDK